MIVTYNPEKVTAEDGTEITILVPVQSDEGKYTAEQLHAAFDLVSNPDNWKLGNTVEVDIDEVPVVLAALRFFTGNDERHVTVTRLPISGTYQINFPGYYAVIGA